MNELVVADEVCIRCGRAGAETSGLCPECATQLLPATPPPENDCRQPVPVDRPPVVGLACLDNRWLVAALVLFAGPVGLPALWLSRRFSRGVKIGVSVAYAALTVALPVAMIWYWCEVSLRPLVDALAG